MKLTKNQIHDTKEFNITRVHGFGMDVDKTHFRPNDGVE